jgi:hypothetical protein
MEGLFYKEKTSHTFPPPYLPTSLYKGINKRSQHGRLGKYQQESKKDQDKQDRGKPPLFTDPEETPQFTEDGKFAGTHKKKRNGFSVPHRFLPAKWEAGFHG